MDTEPTTPTETDDTSAPDAGAQQVEIVEAEIVEDGWTPAPDPAALGIELPDDPAEAQELLLRELSEARQEAGEYLETLQRIAADFDNYRKRVERDHAENVRRASQRVIEQLLPTLDNLDAAIAYEPQTPAEERILEGMKGTRNALLDALSAEGFAPIPAVGEVFDPAVHEAVSGGGDGELQVAQELRRGYTLQGRVLRPSLVTVEQAET
jgi:molecular chaperone GrpE